MRRLLLVDDDQDVRQLIRLWLRQAWDIDEAATGPEALKRCENRRYAAIVLDQRLPRMTGLEVARQLRKRGIETPIVLFSAFLHPEASQEAEALGLTIVSKDNLPRLMESLPV